MKKNAAALELKIALERLGSQVALAKELDMSSRQIHRYMNGQPIPKVVYLALRYLTSTGAI